MMKKTYDGWNGPLEDYLQVGDEVDEALEDYFIGCMWPAYWTERIVAMGEPHDHDGPGGKPRYLSLVDRIYQGPRSISELRALQLKENRHWPFSDPVVRI